MIYCVTKRKKSAFGIQQVRRKKYKRARLRSRATGKRREVLLEDPVLIEARKDEHSLQVDPQYELKFDIKKALRQFSVLERRILFRVIVQGQSVEVATSRMRSSAQRWRKWIAETAFPKLRSQLADYFENGKVVL